MPLGEHLDLVRRGVRAEHHIPVDVVAVRDGSPGVVGREREIIEVLLRRDDGRER